jgi:cation diffusion facilitator CzcD-associated flavoprotein CzcO
MSAVPNLPQSVIRADAHQPQTTTQDILSNKKHISYIEHIEHQPPPRGATTAPQPQTQNGVHVNGDSHAKTEPVWQLHDEPIENQRPIRVIVIGAGYSGVYCGIRIPERIRNCELVIYEKNAGIGGTWYENQYPGAACDVPSHSYQFSFNPKPDWSSLYAPSWEIRDYIEESAKKYGADRFVKLQHEVKDCEWNDEEGKWHVKVQRPDGTVFEDKADVLVSARGLLNNKQWPDIEGLRSFEGEIMHSAAWNPKYDFKGKRVGVIGSGSSAIQIIPKLQKIEGTQMNCFIRSRTWISPPLGQGVQDKMGMGDKFEFTPEFVEKIKNDPQAWLDFRLMVEADANNIHAVVLKGTPMQIGAQKAFEDGMRARLQKKPQYFDWLKPNFSPGCRRLTPGPGFLEALVEDNVNFIRDRIVKIEPKGIVTEDGKLHEIDVLVCATGFYASAAPPFRTAGKNGYTLQEHWHTRAKNYLSLATDQFPNHFFMLGPNGAIGEGSLTMMIETTGSYIMKAIRKIQKENIKSMVIKPERVRDFTQYCDTYFDTTVFMDDCNSW